MRLEIVSILTALVIVACPSGKSHQRALLEWKKNEKMVGDAIAGKGVDEDEYMRAITFLSKLTGMPIRGNPSTFGMLPNEDTARDFAAVQDWCKRNCKYLSWDDRSQSVKVLK